MAGVKGKSGRKSRYEETQKGNLEKVCNDYLLANFNEFPPATKQKIALTICSKAVTQKIESKNENTMIAKDEEKEQIQELIRQYTQAN